MNGRQPSQVSGYHEEADEGAQQAHIQLPQQSRFHCGQRPKHQNRQQTIGQNAESLGRTGKAAAVRQARLIPARGSTTGKKSPAESP